MPTQALKSTQLRSHILDQRTSYPHCILSGESVSVTSVCGTPLSSVVVCETSQYPEWTLQCKLIPRGRKNWLIFSLHISGFGSILEVGKSREEAETQTFKCHLPCARHHMRKLQDFTSSKSLWGVSVWTLLKDGEDEAQKGWVTYPGSHRKWFHAFLTQNHKHVTLPVVPKWGAGGTVLDSGCTQFGGEWENFIQPWAPHHTLTFFIYSNFHNNHNSNSLHTLLILIMILVLVICIFSTNT